MSDALTYELLLCEAHNCERGGANGKADATFYRKMIHAHRAIKVQKEAIGNKQMPVYSQSLDDLEYEARVATAHVKNAVLDALRQLYRNTNKEEDRKALESLMRPLNPDMYDPKVIDETIDKAWEISK